MKKFDLNHLLFFLITLLITMSCTRSGQTDNDEFLIMAYYMGNETAIDEYDVGGLTHIIFSFCHLDGNRIFIRENRIPTLEKLVSVKDNNPGLKILVALGGWGGCETCSEVFSTDQGRSEFAESVLEMMEEYGTDGIDLDWEYPGISGYPGHPWMPEDKKNFTLLVKKLREVLGQEYEIGFASGGFPRFFENSVEWDKVMPVLDYVNVMTYDYRTGTETGHHTALFSSPGELLSADFAVNYLDSIGVERSKIVIGAAFYGRVWENVEDIGNGLFQAGTTTRNVGFRNLSDWMDENNVNEHWCDISSAPWGYSPEKGLFITYDNHRSVELKTRYAKENGLAGIMFWQLGNDKPDGGLLQTIYDAAGLERPYVAEGN
jgi:chitinase